MAKNRGGRPPASELKHRCQAESASGARCGSPSAQGLDVCRAHLGQLSPKAVVKTSDRLIALTGLALDRLEQIIREGADDVAERAARTILDRTVPKPGAQHALVVNIGQGDAATAVPGLGPAEMIRKRLLALASRPTEPAENYSPLGDVGQGDGTQAAADDWAPQDDDVVDAELVDPDPIVVPAADTTPEPLPAYVPHTSTRTVTVEEFKADHAPWL